MFPKTFLYGFVQIPTGNIQNTGFTQILASKIQFFASEKDTFFLRTKIEPWIANIKQPIWNAYQQQKFHL